ncbi:MAG: hypothetical protein WDN45_00890 [Caulobacteraceae bacterium]
MLETARASGAEVDIPAGGRAGRGRPRLAEGPAFALGRRRRRAVRGLDAGQQRDRG